MSLLKLVLLPITLVVVSVVHSQQPVAVQRVPPENGMPSSGGYEPSSTSLMRLLERDHPMNDALMAFARTGDKATYRNTVLKAAQEGNLAAELLLAEQYIPEQCTFEPHQDVPHCGKNGNEPPGVVFRKNPLDLNGSYEEASKWLEQGSAQGSGEASEVLAQLITRMKANGHDTPYTVADSARFHALARSQGFEVQGTSVTCFTRKAGGSGLTVGPLPSFPGEDISGEPFTSEEIQALNEAGFSGSLEYVGESGGGDSVLLSRPEGSKVKVRIILDHDPGFELLLPIPAHHDEIYIQRGEQFLAFPSGGKVLPRFINLEPQTSEMPQVSVFTQNMDGGHSGGFCGRFASAPLR